MALQRRMTLQPRLADQRRITRRTRLILVRAAVTAAVLAGLAGVVPAVAEVTGPVGETPAVGPVAETPAARPGGGVPAAGSVGEPAGALTLILRPDGGTPEHAVLTCSPAGGTHPAPEKACAQLEAVGGEVKGIMREQGMCTMMYDPVTVVAEGLWHGEPRAYQQGFANRCEAVRGTGGVLFNF